MKFHPNNQFYISFLSLASISFILGIIYAFYIKINFTILYLLTLFILVTIIYPVRNFISNGVKINTLRHQIKLPERPFRDYAEISNGVYLNEKYQQGNILIILAFFLIGLLHQTNFSTLYSNDIYYFSKLNLNKVTLEGRIVSQIQKGEFGNSFVFIPKTIKAGDCFGQVNGKVFVRFNKKLELNYGDYLRIEGKLSLLKNKGYFNKSLIRKGIRSILTVRYRDWIAKEKSASLSAQRLAFHIKEELKKQFNDISSPTREFLVALILGDREGLSKEIYSVFRYTGTVHILAISGLNIGIIVFILIVLLKSLRIKQKARFIVTILFLLFYCFITGLSSSVVRAVIMSIVFLLSFIIRREYYIYSSLALAAMIILSIWPWQIFDIGFQLSFISVISIVLISPKILSILPKLKNRLLSLTETSFVVSLAAWLGTTPLVAYYFGMVSLISLVANVFIVVFMPLIIAGGFLYLILNYLFPIWARWLATSMEFIVYSLILLTDCFKDVPFAYFYVEKFSIYIVLIYYALFLVLFNRNYLIHRSRRRRAPPLAGNRRALS